VYRVDRAAQKTENIEVNKNGTMQMSNIREHDVVCHQKSREVHDWGP
jgi:hypothetical protein